MNGSRCEGNNINTEGINTSEVNQQACVQSGQYLPSASLKPFQLKESPPPMTSTVLMPLSAFCPVSLSKS